MKYIICRYFQFLEYIISRIRLLLVRNKIELVYTSILFMIYKQINFDLVPIYTFIKDKRM